MIIISNKTISTAIVIKNNTLIRLYKRCQKGYILVLEDHQILTNDQNIIKIITNLRFIMIMIRDIFMIFKRFHLKHQKSIMENI